MEPGASDPAGFAAQICDAYSNQHLWQRLSEGAQAYASDELSLPVWNQRLCEMLWMIGAIDDIPGSGSPGVRQNVLDPDRRLTLVESSFQQDQPALEVVAEVG